MTGIIGLSANADDKVNERYNNASHILCDENLVQGPRLQTLVCEMVLGRVKAKAEDLGVSPALVDINLTECITHIVYRHMHNMVKPCMLPLADAP